MRHILIFGIILYQRFISPYKGFKCAFAVLYHGDSCSEAVKKILADNQLLPAWKLIKKRFALCSEANKQLKQRKKKKDDRGYCDCPCDLACNIAECIPRKNCPQMLPDFDCDLPCDCGF